MTLPRPIVIGLTVAAAATAFGTPANAGVPAQGPAVLGAPVEFLLFAAILAGVALLHGRTLLVTVAGLVAVIAYKLAFGLEPAALGEHFVHEWTVLANLFLLLVGFAVLAGHFERSNLPEVMPRWLPDNWTGGLALLAMVFCLSAVLDNIAAAMIGGVAARHVYRGGVGIGYLAAIVAASNAGGAGSVIGDTTTTMMWISGVSPLAVAPAFLASIAAFLVFGTFAALQQQKLCPIVRHADESVKLDWMRLAAAAVILATIIAVNLVGNALAPDLEETLPALGLGLWAAIGVTAALRRPDWSAAAGALKGACFLVALVACASLMPVERLPPPSWPTTFGLGALSAVFDNIPLTALAIAQGGYDWALLAFAVGFGGSMIWFGSSAGVALTSLYPEGRSVFAWLRQGWHVPLAYLVGFFTYLALLGWRPEG